MESSFEKIADLAEKLRNISKNFPVSKQEILQQIKEMVENLHFPFWGSMIYFNGQRKSLTGKYEKIDLDGEYLVCTVGNYVLNNGIPTYKIISKQKIRIEDIKSGIIWKEGRWIPENVKQLLKKKKS